MVTLGCIAVMEMEEIRQSARKLESNLSSKLTSFSAVSAFRNNDEIVATADANALLEADINDLLIKVYTLDCRLL